MFRVVSRAHGFKKCLFQQFAQRTFDRVPAQGTIAPVQHRGLARLGCVGRVSARLNICGQMLAVRYVGLPRAHVILEILSRRLSGIGRLVSLVIIYDFSFDAVASVRLWRPMAHRDGVAAPGSTAEA